MYIILKRFFFHSRISLSLSPMSSSEVQSTNEEKVEFTNEEINKVIQNFPEFIAKIKESNPKDTITCSNCLHVSYFCESCGNYICYGCRTYADRPFHCKVCEGDYCDDCLTNCDNCHEWICDDCMPWSVSGGLCKNCDSKNVSK